jgi:dihydroneopterin aldolase/2-amino-4-hydroxy-6-hydroxymethyldihydropteridine diphosphokinase
MFEIIIKDLILFGYHGVNEEEKIKGQEFLFNISILLDKDTAGRNGFLKKDNIKNTVNYSEVIEIVKYINDNNKFDLLETLSNDIAKKILSFSPMIERVMVRVEKISPPISEKIGSVGAEIQVKKEKELKVFISLGSNLGDREKNLRGAVDRIDRHRSIDVIKVSSIYETEPMYVKDQDSFFNIVIGAGVGEGFSPFEMLGYLKSIEYSMGRKENTVKYGPRVIDIDILYFGETEIISDFLVIPHPRISERKFVLMPLNEIAPDFRFNNRSMAEILKNSNLKEEVEKIKNW